MKRRYHFILNFLLLIGLLKAQQDYSLLYTTALKEDSAKNYSAALQTIAKITDEKKIINDSVLLLRARVYFENGDMHHALTDAEAAVKLNDKNHQAYFLKGMIKSKTENFPGAIKSFSKAIKLAPAVAKYYYDRGIAYLLQEDVDDAIKDFEKTLQLDPGYAHAWYSLGYSQELLGKTEEAMKSLQKAIEIDKTYTDPYMEIAFIYLKKGEKDKACAEFETAKSAGCKVNEELKINFCK